MTESTTTISATWDQASDGTFVATVRVSDLASAEQAKADLARMRNALSTQQPELPALPDERATRLAFAQWDTMTTNLSAAMKAFVDGNEREVHPNVIDRWEAWKAATIRAQAVLADRERRKVVAWRYLPSPTWGEYVITQDPKVAEDARACGIEVEEMTVGRHSKVEDKT